MRRQGIFGCKYSILNSQLESKLKDVLKMRLKIEFSHSFQQKKLKWQFLFLVSTFPWDFQNLIFLAMIVTFLGISWFKFQVHISFLCLFIFLSYDSSYFFLLSLHIFVLCLFIFFLFIFHISFICLFIFISCVFSYFFLMCLHISCETASPCQLYRWNPSNNFCRYPQKIENSYVQLFSSDLLYHSWNSMYFFMSISENKKTFD